MATDPVIPFDYLEREKRRAQAPKGSDPIAEAMGILRQEQIRSTIIRAPDPATTANATRVARAAGEPPALIEDRVAEVAKAQNADKFTRVLGQYPAFTGWAIQNPRDAVAAQNDHKSLGLLGTAWDMLTGGLAQAKLFDVALRSGSPPGVTEAGGALASGGVTTLRVGTSIPAWALDAAGVDVADNAFRSGDLYLEGQAKALMPRSKNWATNQILGGISNAPMSVASLFGGTALKSVGFSTRTAAIASVLPMSLQQGSESYFTARDQGVSRATASLYGIIDTVAEAGGEYASSKIFIGSSGAGESILKRYIKQVVPDVAGELGTTTAEKFSAWAFLPENQNKTLGDLATELPEAWASTAVQTLVAGGLTNITIAGLEKTLGTMAERRRQEVSGKLTPEMMKAEDAARERSFFTKVEKANATSELKTLDPEAHARMMGEVADANGVSSVFVPAEAVIAYQQSDAYDQFEDPFSPYQAQIDEAVATGGDVVLPADFALGTLPGTAAWSAIKDDLRLRPGGMSSREADDFNSRLDEIMGGMTQQRAEIDQAQAGEIDARATMVERVTKELQNAGFTPTNATVQAELIAQRAATRASRLGRNMQPGDFDTRIMAVLPPALAEMQKADNVDLVINAMRGGKDATKQTGKSLLGFIASKGGIEDRGGDVAAMGGDKWHVGKVGKRKLLKAYSDAQGTMIGSSGANPNTISNLLDAAISEGYFPDLLARRENGEKIDDRVLLDAIGQELGGTPVYAEAAKVDDVRLAADELRQMLEDAGRDPTGMTDAEIRRAIADQVQAMRGDGTIYDQMPETLLVDGVERSTRNSEGMPLARSEEGVRAFWAWFGESKVVDEEGRPLVVYHGTGADIDAFNGITWASVGTGLAQEYASMREVRGQGVANVLPLYMRAERVFDADLGLSKSETVGSFFNEALEQAMAQGREFDIERARSLLGTIRDAGKREESGPRYAREDFWFEPETMFGKVGATAIRDLFDLLGFDSIKMQENGTDTYGAFAPTQIKSINNRGTFDPADARILYQQAPPSLKPAVRVNGKVYSSVVDHLSAISNIPDAEQRARARSDGENRGFVNERGRYLDRYKAAQYAKDYGLLSPDAPAWAQSSPELISENLMRWDQQQGRSLYQSAFHGSPHIFDRFSLDAIGTGEGAQAFGWGLYFAGRKEIAEHYRNTLTLNVGFDYGGSTGLNRSQVENLVNMKYGGRYLDNILRPGGVADKVMDDLIYGGKNNYKEGSERRAMYVEIAADLKRPDNAGRLYAVEIPDDNEYLLWDSALSKQSDKVQAALKAIGFEFRQPEKPTIKASASGKSFAVIAPGGWELALFRSEAKAQDYITKQFLDVNPSGQDIYRKLSVDNGSDVGGSDRARGDKASSLALLDAGVVGIKYRDGGSRGLGSEGTFNYVVFDDSRVSITAYEQSAEVVAREKALFDDLMNGLKTDGTSNVTDAFEQMKVLSNAREDWAKALGQEPGGVELKNRSGMRAAITKSQENADGWRVTWFDDRGFSGHVELKTKEEAAHLAIFEGYDIPAPGALRAAMKSGTFFQRALNEGPRGRISFPANGFGTGPATIELFQNRNPSTLLHELSHQWLEELRYDANLPGAPDQLKADWQTVQDWFADNGHAVVDGFIPTEAHEMWARGGERYLMEGKSPSSALTRMFETFRSWLLNVYRTVDALRSPISPEIRGVFDRLLATDEEIAQQREAQALMPLFKDAASIGMTGAEFDAYTQQATGARDQASASLLQKTMASIRRRETKKFNDERRGVMADEAERLDDSPILKSLRMMQATPISVEWLRDRMGQDVTDLLPKRVPPIWKEGGMNPDALAEMAGFPSGQEMIEVLIGAEKRHREQREGGDQRTLRARMIDQAADAEMQRRYGDDPFNDGSIEQEAIAAVNGELAGELLATEVRALGRRTGQRPTPYKIAREWARGRVRGGVVAEEASPGAIQRHARNAAKAGREAEKAMLAGKMDEAFAAKQRQMLSSALLAEAKEANDYVTAAVKRLSSVAKNRKRDSIDPDYWDQAQAVLAGYDFIPRTEKLMKEREGFEKWAAARRAEDDEVQIPERMVAPGTNYTRMTVEQIAGIDNLVESILHLGRRKKELLLGKERRDWHEARGEWLDGAEALPERPAGPDRNASPSKVRGLISNLVRIDMMAKNMDGGNPNGLMTRIFANGAKTADNTFARLQKTVLEPIAEAYMAMKDNRLFDRVSTPEWIDYRTGRPQVFMRSDLLAIAHNLGNESNLRKMLAGEALLFKGQEELAPTLEGVTAMLNRELNEAEWQLVITGWRRVEMMGEEAFAAERELTGVKPEKIEPRMVQTPFGKVEGGYWPAVYDTDPIRAADAGVNLETFNGDDFEALIGKNGIGTNKGYTISRTDFVAPMLLNYEAVLFGHVNQVAKRVAYQAWAKNALKVIRDRRVKAMWARKLGEEYHAQLEPWLRDTINQGQIANMGHLSAVNSILRTARMNLSTMGLVFRATTLIAQVGGLPNSMKAVGAENVAKGFRIYAQDGGAMIARIMEASPLMARRLNEFDRDQAAALAAMQSPPTTEMGRKLKPLVNARDRFNAAGFHLIGAIQLYTVDLPTWAGAYDKAMRPSEDGGLDLDHDAAVDFADRMVEEAQGAGRAAQLAAIQRAGEMSRIVTLFYTFFGTVMNYQWEMAQDIRGGKYRKAAVSAGWIMVVAPLVSALIGDAIRGNLPDDDDDDTWLAWAMRKVFFGMFSGIPIVRDFANQVERKAAGQYAPDPVTPWQRIGSAIGGGSEDAFAAISQTDSYRLLQENANFLPEPTEVSDKWVKNGIEAVGFATGTGLGQVATTSQFVADVSSGRVNPESAGDYVQGAITGKIKEDQ